MTQRPEQSRLIAYLVTSATLVVLGLAAGLVFWSSDLGLHTGLELASAIVAAVVGFIALLRYYSRKSSGYLFVGVGFLGAAVFNMIHTITSSPLVLAATDSPLPAVVGWGWFAERVFLGIFLILAWWSSTRTNNRITSTTGETGIYLASIVAAVVVALLIIFTRLPTFHFADAPVGRPYELVPGVLFTAALAGYLSHGAWRRDTFEHWLVLSLIVHLGIQFVFMPYSPAPFGVHYDLAHVLKIVAYTMTLGGLVLSMRDLFQVAAHSKAELSRFNMLLTAEVGQRATVERTLSAEKAHLEAVLRGLAEGVVFAEPDGRIISMNDSARALIGQQLDGDDYGDATAKVRLFLKDGTTPVPVEDRPMARALRGEAVTDQIFLFAGNGDTRWFYARVNARPVYEGGRIIGAVTAFTDITAEFQAQRAIQEREARLQAIVQNAPDAVVTIDTRSRIREFNPVAEQTFGYSKDEILGEQVTLLMPARFRDRHYRGVERYLERGEGVLLGQTVELTGLHRDGREFPIEISLASWHDAEDVGFTAILRDISRRKRSETRLRESEQIYRAMVTEATDYAIFMLDPEGHVKTWNEGAARIMRYEPAEVIGQHFRIFFPQEEQAARIPERELETARAEGRAEVEGWRRRRDGSRWYARTVVTAIRGDDGSLLGYSKIIQDRTEELEAETRLRESEQIYRAMVTEATDYAIFMLDPEGHVKTWNEGAARIMKYEPAEVIGQHFRIFFPEEEQAARIPERELETARAEGRAEVEGWRTRKDGSRWCARSVVTAIRGDEGTLLGYSKIIQDRTEELEAERLLRESELRYRLLAENAGDLIAIHDTEGRFVYASPAAQTLLGYAPDEIEGRKATEFLHEEDAVVFERVHRAVIHAEESLQRTFRFPHRAGHLVWLEVTLRWMGNGDSEARDQVLATYHDVTERVQDRNALARSNEELQEFAFIASHDLKEPLRKIIAFGERIESQHQDDLSERGLDYLERMRGAALRMRTLLDDLLAYSRVTTKAQPFVPVDLEEVVREVVEDLGTRIEETVGHVEVGDLPALEADPTQMRQLFQNLISNGLKYHQDDVPPLVRIYGSEPDGRVRITVEDNGIGFDMQHAERIFRPFQRLHGRSEYSGSGIGLAIVRKIVERHNGTIEVDSEPGRGSRFTFEFPRRQLNELSETVAEASQYGS